MLPAWIEKHDETRIAVNIDPSMAFGTGTHPSTQLCLEMVESYTQPGAAGDRRGLRLGHPGDRRPASWAPAMPWASTSTTLRSGPPTRMPPPTRCSKTWNAASARWLKSWQGQFSLRQAPLVLANILAPVIMRLFDAGLADLVAPAGMLVLSGILAEQAADVKTAAAQHGLHFKEMRPD